jgi:nucleotide-binding universal stress UspA family protein
VSQFCGIHRAPRAGIDRIDSQMAALAVIRLAMHLPLTSETIALVLDADHRGRTVVVVDGTDESGSVLEVTERLADAIATSGHDGALVLASVRPGGEPAPADADLWLEASELAEAAGVELLEWFVIGEDTGPPTAWCPRDLLAEPPRWRSS